MTPEQLKASILQYAIQGKLVEQRAEEGTADVLFQQIQQNRKKKNIKEKKYPSITEDEIPYDIPDTWKWVRVSEICSILNGDRGKNYPAKSTLKKEGIPFISALNLDGHTVKNDDNLLCLSNEQYEKLGNGKLIKGDIVVCIRGSLGKHGRYPYDKGAIASSLVICRQFSDEDVLADYFMMYIDAPLFYALIRKYDNGTAQPNLAAKSLEQFLFPLPPLEEQHRIVTKIEELLPFVDSYAKAYEKLEQFNTKFPEEMKKSILQYAIMGKLVEQRAEEGTAEELYQQIQDEKQKLIRTGKFKKDKAFSDITDDEMPFDIPDNWKWVRVGDIFNVGTGMTPTKSESRFYLGGTIPWVNSSLTSNRYIEHVDTMITQYALDNTSLRLYPAHTLIVAMYGQGKTRGQISELLLPATTNQACAALESYSYQEVTTKYVYYCFLFNYEKLRKRAEGTSQPNLNVQKIKETIIPFPPLEEQQRIVAKIEELLPYCEILSKCKQ
ncbi:restriction endonuclease subunit S [Butyrivibrio sp. M55]|uniref:restriction endonuclease subunit S n=1 Tax=Butyrivibrio sp. M55 TaxID=1855323 RepID=UPI0008E0545B|nr:restriction endonuclease subunit S [Butyrivibrio sp. M55]SFU87036.1 type I restriction enzyme, S subunit [Butyrivibrio sp. M55]